MADIEGGYNPNEEEDKYAAVVEFIQSKWFTGTMTLFTLFALIGDDFRLAVTPKSADDVFFTISIIALVLFLLELMLNAIFVKKYLCGFYFILDFLAMLSLIPDIGWIWDPITGTPSVTSAASLVSNRASRLGERASKFVRVVRLIRLVRIVKLYKMAAGESDAKLNAEMRREPSKVGKKLTELTTRRVMVLVLLMAIVLPFLDGNILNDNINTFHEGGLHTLHHMPQDKNLTACSTGSCISEATFKGIFQDYVRESGKLFYIHVCAKGCRTVWPVAVTNSFVFTTQFAPAANQSYSLYTNPVNGWNSSEWMRSEDEILTRYRANEASLVEIVGCFNVSGVKLSDACVSRAYFDLTSEARSEAGLNIAKTFFIMLVLGAGSMMFTRDAERLVIAPIERMVSLVKKLAENPLATIQSKKSVDEEATEGRYETALLEDTLRKIGALLKVGFGEAGSEIIGKNMQNQGALNPMIPGKKITAIFGFCDIRQFTDTTECLQDEVMVYVNKIGDIVHSCTHLYYGAANKNIGDAFLLAWKICDGDLEEEEEKGEVLLTVRDERRGGERVITPQEMADSALTAFIKIVIDLDNANRGNGSLAAYHENEAVLARFGEGFEIKMGFGMHVGWAIEGAIGSTYKIDASYLSPNVNMAARLEAATKQFRTPLLLSHWFVELLSPAARFNCRRIDRVTVKGSNVPMTLYTYDVVNVPDLFMEPRYDAYGDRVPVNFRDKVYSRLQRSVPRAFYGKFEEAMAAYVNGEWPLAQQELQAALELKAGDGPGEALLEVMAKHDFVAPEGWAGFRELTEK